MPNNFIIAHVRYVSIASQTTPCMNVADHSLRTAAIEYGFIISVNRESDKGSFLFLSLDPFLFFYQ